MTAERAIGGRPFVVPLGVIAVAALAVRLVSLATVATNNPDGGDPLYYHVQANLLADGHGFAEPFTWLTERRIVPTAVHPPLFSLVLAVPSLFGGDGFLAHKVTACLVGTATVVVVGLVGRRVAGPRAGLVAAALAAVYPQLWVIDGILMPEGLFALTIALTLLAAYRFADAPSSGRAAVLGAAIAAATLTRGEAILLVPLLVLPLAFRQPRLLAVAGLATALVLAPWTIRNTLRFERMVPISTNGDEVLAYANCDSVYGGEFIGFWDLQCHFGNPQGDETQRAKFWRDQGIEYAREHASRLPAVIAAREGRVWDLYRPWQNAQLSTVEGRDLRVARAGLVAYWVLVPCAAFGVVALRRRGVKVWPLLVPFVVVAATVAYAYGVTRFRVPAEVALVVLAGAAADHVFTSLRRNS